MISMALQHGSPLAKIIEKLEYMGLPSRVDLPATRSFQWLKVWPDTSPVPTKPVVENKLIMTKQLLLRGIDPGVTGAVH